jgi:hypothetical protein
MNPVSNGSASFGEVAEVVLPDTFLLEAAEKPLDDSILLRRIGSDELLAQPVVAAWGAKAPALKDQTLSLRTTRVAPSSPRA